MFSVVFLERTLLCQSTQIQENPQTSFSSPIFFSSEGVKEEPSNCQTPLYFLSVGGLNGLPNNYSFKITQ